MKTALTTLGISLLVLAGCTGQKQPANDFIQENIDNAVAQEMLQTDIIEKSGKILNPRTINKDGSIHYVPIDDWCSGFFPGNIWYTYELTGDDKWLPLAEKYTEAYRQKRSLRQQKSSSDTTSTKRKCSFRTRSRFLERQKCRSACIPK